LLLKDTPTHLSTKCLHNQLEAGLEESLAAMCCLKDEVCGEKDFKKWILMVKMVDKAKRADHKEAREIAADELKRQCSTALTNSSRNYNVNNSSSPPPASSPYLSSPQPKKTY